MASMAIEALEVSPKVAQEQICSADIFPEIEAKRRNARIYASQILEQNRDLIASGDEADWDNVPLAIDVLGTSKRVVEAEKLYGVDSPEYNQLFSGLVLDSQRLYAEAYRKKSWEYFPASYQRRDQDTGRYFSHSQDLLTIASNGLSPDTNSEERQRRINEYVEEVTYQAIGSIALDNTISTLTISECTNWAISAYNSKAKGSHGGYVPEIEKVMLRGVRFNNHFGRSEEQLGISGKYITHDVITSALIELGAVENDIELNKTKLHGTQFIDKRGRSVIDFVKILDQKASKYFSKNIFMGEEVGGSHPKDYDNVYQEASERRKLLAESSLDLANYLIKLTKNKTDKWLSEGLVDAHVKQKLLALSKHDPNKAEIIFNRATAEGLKEVNRLQSLGLMNQARTLEDQVAKNAPSVSFCGAGSCGLEAVGQFSDKQEKASKLGLKGELVSDKVRHCPGCGNKSIIYEVKTGNKACASCGITEINKKRVNKKNELEDKAPKKLAVKST